MVNNFHQVYNMDYFPRIYYDELFYSIISRYHFHIGNLGLKSTFMDIFGDINKIPTIEFPSGIKLLIKKLPSNYGLTEEDILYNNTAFPYYAPFLPQKRAMKIKKMLIDGNGKGVKTQIGFIAGSICRKKGIMYCYQCALEEMNNYGEAYFHLSHQLQGVFVCEKHKCYLQQYPNSSNSKFKFVRMDLEALKQTNNIKNKSELTQLIKIAIGVKYLLKNNLKNYDQEKIHNMYMLLLKDKGYTTVKKHIRQRKLYNDFMKYYSSELLNILESNISCYNQYNWLALITRKPKVVIHPIRHILFIMFLCGSVDKFFSKDYKFKEKRVYPCLNPVCSHYKQFVVTNVIISKDYKSWKSIGTFTCDNCGFKYSRKMDGDMFKIGRIKEFGPMWEEKLKSILIINKFSLRKIAGIMGCDCKTVVKYAQKLGLRYLLKSTMKFNCSKHNDIYNISNLNYIYKKDILNEINENLQLSRSDIRKKLKKQYIYLYRHDKEWLFKSLPPKQKSIVINKRSNNWNMKDNEILKKLKNEYKNISSNHSRTRITISLLGNKVGELANIQKNIDKLPHTKAYLKSVCETVTEYQLKRVDEVCTKLIQSDEIIKEWKVIRLAGLKNTIQGEVKNRILYYVNNFNSK